MKRLTLLLIACCLLATSVRADEVAPSAFPVSKSIAWRSSVLDAFVEAVENGKPMVVLFALHPSQATVDGRHVSNEQRQEFDRPELAALADEAVFVVCHYDSTTGQMQDEYGERVRKHLNVTTFPATLTIAPRTDRLTEAGRFEGLFAAVDMAVGLRHDLRLAMMTDAERAQLEATRRAFAQPRSPEEAVNYYSEALANGDTFALSRIFAEPYGTRYDSMAATAGELSASKQRLRAALDEQFGVEETALDVGHDLEMMRQNLLYVTEVAFLGVKSATMDTAVVEARISQTDAAPYVADLELVREGDVWRILPGNRNEVDLIAYYESRANEAKFQAMQLDLITDQVRRGEFASREQAVQAALVAGNAASVEDGGQFAG
jgi:hypothetical protein